MNNSPHQKLRLAYLSGPVDGVEVFDAWKSSRRLAYFGASHLTDFFQLCDDLDADAYVITTLANGHRCYRSCGIVIENRPQPSDLDGLSYHVANAIWLIRTIPAILRFNPDVLVVTAAQNYWFLLAPLRLRRLKIIPAITCTLWPKYQPRRLALKILLTLNGVFLRYCVAGVTVMSEDIASQVRKLLGGRAFKIETFLPVYERAQFASFASVAFEQAPFRVLFAGRIETNKGVYDLIEVARLVEARMPGRFRFDICGDGSQLSALRQYAADLCGKSVVVCHGFCDRERLSSLLQESHVVIVPTTTKFEEGFNMVCAEAILACRPVVTSAVCPALTYVKDAAVEVAPDDVEAYADALVGLLNDRGFYESKQKACKLVQEQFYDPRNSWGAKLKELLETSRQ